jgi:HK97 family phage prohead protease
METLYSACQDLEVKETSPEDGQFEGRLSVYGIEDAMGDIVERGAFRKTIQEKAGGVPLLWQHDARTPIGWLNLSDDEDALRVKGHLVLGVPQARSAYALLRAGVVKGLSIGFETVKAETGEDGVRRLKELKLWEGSLVTFPANQSAQVDSVKSTKEMEALQAKVEALEAKLALAPDAQAATTVDEPVLSHSEAKNEEDLINRFGKIILGGM